jgi:putative cell wall-binding protein
VRVRLRNRVAWAVVMGAVLLTARMPDGAVTPARSAVDVQATASQVPWDGRGRAPCPEGSTRAQSVLAENFTNGLPQQRFLRGFQHIRSGITGPGARSTMPANGTKVRDHMFLDWAHASPGAPTMLAFATRGTTSGGYYATVDINSRHIQVPVGQSTWSGRVYDVSSATADEGGDLGTWFEHRAITGRTTFWDIDNVQVYTCRPAPVSRVGGEDRYDTSARISGRFPASPAVAYLVSGSDFPDGLSASAPAAAQGGPVLLVRRTAIPETVQAELARLRPARIVVVGGSAAVSDTVVEQARRYATTGQVERISGVDRYDTSARVALTFPAGGPVAFVATGHTFPDALAGSALAGHRNAPLLLTPSTTLPASVRTALQTLSPASITIFGGTGGVSAAVEQELRDLATTGTVTRIAGPDRYATAASVAAEFPGAVPLVYVAAGTTFPDALSGAAVAGAQGVPVLLAAPTSVPAPTLQRLGEMTADAAVLLGGAGALAPVVMDVVGGAVG